MDFDQLRTYVAAAELGSLRKAALRLNLSQPAASARIKALEEEFGIALFERSQRGLVLTRNGASLLPTVQRLLADAKTVIAEAKNLNGRLAGPVRLACVPAAFDKSFLSLGEILRVIADCHRDLNIEVYQRSSKEVWAGVKDGMFDAGLAFSNNEISNIHQIPLREVPYRIVCACRLELDVRRTSWKELAEFPWVTCAQGGKHHDMALQVFRRFDHQPKKIIHGENEPVITGMVMAGMGLGLMREGLALREEAAKQISIIGKLRPSTQLQAICRAGRESDPAIRTVLEVFRAHPGPSPTDA